MKSKRFIIFIIIVLMILIIPLIIYVINFGSFYLSENHLEWSIFSNYYSGITMPFISFANVIVIIWLSISVAKLDDDRKDTELKFQQKIFEISNKSQRDIAVEANNTLKENLKIQFQFEQYCKVSDKLELIGIQLFKETVPQGTIINVQNFLTEFSLTMRELLPALNNDSFVKDINTTLEKLRESFKGHTISTISEPKVYEINDILDDFQVKKLVFLRNLQKSILSEKHK